MNTQPDTPPMAIWVNNKHTPDADAPRAISQAGGSAPPAVPEPSFFYAVNRKRVGPVPLSQLQGLAATGQLKPGDMVLKEGTQAWVEAASVCGEFAGLPASQQGMDQMPSQPEGRTPARRVMWEVLDFRRMVAPVVIQALFWVGTTTALLSAGATALLGFLVLVYNRPVSLSTFGVFLGFCLAAIVQAVVGTLLVRLMAELAIVPFRIQESLRLLQQHGRRD